MRIADCGMSRVRNGEKSHDNSVIGRSDAAHTAFACYGASRPPSPATARQDRLRLLRRVKKECENPFSPVARPQRNKKRNQAPREPTERGMRFAECGIRKAAPLRPRIQLRGENVVPSGLGKWEDHTGG